MNAYPMPTSPGLSNNLVTSPTRTQDWNQFDVRIDHTQSERNNFLARYSRSKTATDQPVHVRCRPAAWGVESRGPRQRGHLRRPLGAARAARRVRLGARVLDRVWSSTRASATTASTSISRKPMSQLAISSASSSACPTPTSRMSRMASRSSARRATRASVRAARCRSSATRRTLQYVANLTYAADKHTIKTGLDVRRRHMSEFQTNRGNGRFNFSPNITNNPANNTGGTRDGLVSARRAEPHRAGLPAGRRGHPRQRVQRLRCRRLARVRTG